MRHEKIIAPLRERADRISYRVKVSRSSTEAGNRDDVFGAGSGNGGRLIEIAGSGAVADHAVGGARCSPADGDLTRGGPLEIGTAGDVLGEGPSAKHFERAADGGKQDESGHEDYAMRLRIQHRHRGLAIRHWRITGAFPNGSQGVGAQHFSLFRLWQSKLDVRRKNPTKSQCASWIAGPKGELRATPVGGASPERV